MLQCAGQVADLTVEDRAHVVAAGKYVRASVVLRPLAGLEEQRPGLGHLARPDQQVGPDQPDLGLDLFVAPLHREVGRDPGGFRCLRRIPVGGEFEEIDAGLEFGDRVHPAGREIRESTDDGTPGGVHLLLWHLGTIGMAVLTPEAVTRTTELR